MSKFINKVEIQGYVGTVRTYNGVKLFSVCTENIISYDNPVIETVWISCKVLGNIKGADKIAKGEMIHIKGRMSTTNFTDSKGDSRRIYDLLVSDILDISENGD